VSRIDEALPEKSHEKPPERCDSALGDVEEARLCSRSLENRAGRTASGFKTSDYVSMLRELAPEIDGSVRGKLYAARLPDARGFFAFKGVLEIGDGRHCNALEVSWDTAGQVSGLRFPAAASH
jgi:hypothetical protein